MKRWLQFVAGILLICGPTALFGWYTFWMVYWVLKPQFYDQGYTMEFDAFIDLSLLFFAVISAVFGVWLVRRSHGEDDHPRSLFSSSVD